MWCGCGKGAALYLEYEMVMAASMREKILDARSIRNSLMSLKRRIMRTTRMVGRKFVAPAAPAAVSSLPASASDSVAWRLG